MEAQCSPGRYDRAMLTIDAEALLVDLESAQREAVTTVRGPLCILAGAGTGKTRVISRRVAYALATEAIRPSDVLVVTFTDKAATEMRDRLAAAGRPRRVGVHVPCRRPAPVAPLLGRASTAASCRGVLSSKASMLAPLAASAARRLPLPRGPRPGRGDRVGEGATHRAREPT